MGERVIGVLGGMGPEATIAFYARVVSQTPAARDQDHLRVVIDSNPKIPDRTAAVLGQGESPVAAMAASIDVLQRAGADFVVIPCVSAHAFIDDLTARIRLPLLSILDAVAEHIQAQAGIRRVGLLATAGTVRAGLFQRRLADAGVDVVLPGEDDQARVMAAIYSVKASPSSAQREQATLSLREVAARLIARGAQGIVLGCTEIPLVFGAGDAPVPVFDSLMVLARASIRAAGLEPLPAEV